MVKFEKLQRATRKVIVERKDMHERKVLFYYKPRDIPRDFMVKRPTEFFFFETSVLSLKFLKKQSLRFAILINK